MGQNPYPVELQAGDDKGPVIYAGDLTFKDPSNQPGGGGFSPVAVTSDLSPFAASPGDLIVCDTTDGPIEVDLPVTPPDGSEVAVWVIDASNQVSVIGPINGGSEVDLNDQYAQLVVVYVADDDVWAVLSEGVPGAGGGGLPTGWTEDDSDPATVSTNGGELLGDNGVASFGLTPTSFTISSDMGNTSISMDYIDGFLSAPQAGSAAYTADPEGGATVALDAGGLDIANAGDVDGATLGPTFAYVTVQAAPPTTYLTPLVQDTTAVSGGVYAWDGSAYQKISSV